ncbi:MAG: hypothetical protein EKK48_17200 [Candidatus Melainabacteria bacterium]|nr:MAG: hypothetical protein EKK48_17200 [Candidatus Melainabacteria bacterium]
MKQIDRLAQRRSRIVRSALVLVIGLFGCGGWLAAKSAPDIGETINGLAPARDPDSGLTYMMPPGFFSRERQDGSTAVGDVNGSHFSVDVQKVDFKTEADMIAAIEVEAQRLSDRKSEKNLKVHGCMARQWYYTNKLGATRLLVIATPKYLIDCLWHADIENDASKRACDTFFNSINPNCPKCNLPKN